MKILNMCIFSDTRTQGGIQFFGRILKNFYGGNEIIFFNNSKSF